MNTERRLYKFDRLGTQRQLIGSELERLMPPSHLGLPRKFELRDVYDTI
ncbi:hypothetical protein [Crateriforma conspicua]|uniref:Uncharacterized protein n=1 Tax=Crateriforma conspicua TaxID=2527996 RepID=A0A5C5XQS2_9PLAN|nr:hypothetical protein [Crateriforma conspicua]TWT65556.1 hypothetical protein Pan14r_51030 [Crateriforma conspicua]